MASPDDMKGSKISLVTNSDVRYEGILHEVDYAAATLTVANVRSFGTEDRKTASGAIIPASDQVYEFIVFQAAMIKDLNVVTVPVLADPAIVSASAGKPIPAEPAVSAAPQATSAPQAKYPQVPAYMSSNPHGGSSSYYSAHSGNSRHDNDHRGDHRGEHRNDHRHSDRSNPSHGNVWQNPRRPPPEPVPAQKLEFKEDFDFEKSNAQLESLVGQLKLNDSAKNATAPSATATATATQETAPATFYDPSTSFFDNISCGALDRKNGASGPRKTRQEEQHLNTQTFGAEGATFKSAHARRGRGGRGGRGRGSGSQYPRGGSGGYSRGGGNGSA